MDHHRSRSRFKESKIVLLLGIDRHRACSNLRKTWKSHGNLLGVCLRKGIFRRFGQEIDRSAGSGISFFEIFLVNQMCGVYNVVH